MALVQNNGAARRPELTFLSTGRGPEQPALTDQRGEVNRDTLIGGPAGVGMVVGDIATGTELAVIGGGPGGYTAAIRAAQQGIDTTLIERDAYGGTCLNYGCIPSKAFVTASGLAHRVENAEGMGIHARADVDMAGMTAWKDEVVDRLTGGVEKLCKGNGVNLVDGTAEFSGSNSLRVAHGGGGQGSETVEFESAIIATGSRPVEVPGFEFDGERILSSRGALALESVPESLVVVGAGYIGMELSTVFAKLGAEVTVVEMLEDALPGYEDDITRIVRKRAESVGVEFHFGEAAESWEEAGDGITARTEDEDGVVSEFDAEKVMVAVGRRPVTETVNLEAAGVETTENGFV